MKKRVSLLFLVMLLSLFVGLGFAVDSTISNLPDGGSSLSSSDIVPIVQSGITKRATVGQITGRSLYTYGYQPVKPSSGMLWWDTSATPIWTLKSYTASSTWSNLLMVNASSGQLTQIGTNLFLTSSGLGINGPPSSYGLAATHTGSVTNVPTYPLSLGYQSTGSITAGLGTGIKFSAGSTVEQIEPAAIAGVITNVNSGSEAGGFVIFTKPEGGSLTEAVRVLGDGAVLVNSDSAAGTEKLRVNGRIQSDANDFYLGDGNNGTVEFVANNGDATKPKLRYYAPSSRWEYSDDGSAFVAFSSIAGNPAGSILAFMGETAPTGYLECNGAAVSRETYADLFAAIGTRFGIGDGSTTFNLPDLRGRFLRGWDHGAGLDPDKATRTDSGDGTVGDHVGTKQADEFKAHVHSAMTTNNQQIATGGSSYNHSSGDSGSTGGNETRPVNIYVMYCIKY